MSTSPPLIRLSDCHYDGLRVPEWSISPGEGWCLFGLNGSGKQWVDQLLVGEIAPQTGRVEHVLGQQDIALISFERQQAIYEEEWRLAATDMIPEDEWGTRVADFLPSSRLDDPLIDALNMRHRLRAFYRELSTGESRKLMVLKALLEDARLLVCDNPFDSLDPGTVAALNEALSRAVVSGASVVLLLSNRSDIPAWVERFAHIDEGLMTVFDGESREAQLAQLEASVRVGQIVQPGIPDDAIQLESYEDPYVAELNDCTVQYGGRQVLKELTVKIAPLQHTLVTGENGAGKSTLLGLITGDCMQCFSNDVTVFGHRRGSGESVWEIKRHLGLVSNDLHRRYTVRCDVLSVICSGFFDSIGLYVAPTELQVRLGKEWLEAVGMSGKAELAFQSLSYGEQRLVLIARAMVKSPLLLVLDEPTQGLDEINRDRILGFMSALEARRHSTLLFVSHRQDEFLPLFEQHIHLKLEL
ncbi:MAG: ATP-binding cassette domain-containing protein [Luminiphilus sp.]